MAGNIVFLAVALLAFGTAPSIQSPLTTGCSDFSKMVDSTVQLDPSRYDGIWYEQVRTKDSPFEGDCFCAEANYTIASDGSIIVDNTCRRGSAVAPVSGAIGKAIVPDDKHPGFLLVSFGIPFLKAPYAVLDTDYTSYSIIASCPRFGFGRWYVWILTREQQPGVHFIDGLRNKTVSMGFSASEFVTSYQGDHCNQATRDLFEPVSGWDDYF